MWRAIPRDLKLLNLICRDASRLASDALDRPLRGPERVGLAIHLVLCRNCRRYGRAIRLLREVVRAPDASFVAPDPLPPDARARIRGAIDGRAAADRP